jgi:putative transposase
MARPFRSILPDGIFHAVARGVDGTLTYRDDADYLTFLTLVRDNTVRLDWTFHALCLMPNHFHFVLETSVPRLSAGFHRLNGVYAQRFNERHGRTGHLFGDRFWCDVIDTDERLERVCRYVVNNPVRAGLCPEAADWPWSACRYRLELD